MSTEDRASFGAWLRYELRVRGWSIRELGRRIGISQAAISGWIRPDDPAIPTEENVAALAGVLGVHPEQVHAALGRVDPNRHWSQDVTRLADQIESLHPGDRQAVEALIRALAERQPETR